MKRISYSSSTTWSFWLGPVLPSFIYGQQQGYHQTVWHKTLVTLGVCIALWLLAWIGNLVFEPTVYDDGDALVIIKRRRQIRIPFSNISRVSYQGSPGSRGVTLQFSAPRELGPRFQFQLARQSQWADHHVVADDLHRRSRCCKDLADEAGAAHPS